MANSKTGRNNRQEIFYEDINVFREILRAVYLYGCYKAVDYTQASGVSTPLHEPVSRSNFSKNRKRINAYLPESFFSDENLSCDYNLYDKDDQVMMSCFLYGAVRPEKVNLTFLFLQAFSDNEELSFSEMQECCYKEDCSDQDETGNLQSEKYNVKTMMDARIALEREGILMKTGYNRFIKYKLNKNAIPAELFTVDELQAVCRYLDFASKTFPIQIPFYYAFRRIRLALLSKEMEDNTDLISDLDNHILYRQNFLFDELDDDQLYRFLIAIRTNRTVSFFLYSDKYRYSSHLIPVKVIYDNPSGRKYLLAYDLPNDKIVSVRIDRVKEVSISSKATVTSEQKKVAEQASHRFDYVWSSSPFGSEPKDCRIDFDFTRIPEDYGYRFRAEDRLMRDTASHAECSVEWMDHDHAVMKIHITDAREMVPWLRTFGRTVYPEDAELRKYMAQHWREAFDYYENGILPTGREQPQISSHAPEKLKHRKTTLIGSYENMTFEAFTFIFNYIAYKGGDYKLYELDRLCQKYLGIPTAFTAFAEDNPYDCLFRVKDNCIDRMENLSPLPVFLTKLEKEALVNSVYDPRAQYFLSSDLISRTKAMIPEGQLFWHLSDIEMRNRPKTEVFSEDLHEKINLIRHGLKSGSAISFDYTMKNGTAVRDEHRQMLQLEYFNIHDTMILKMVKDDGGLYSVNIPRMRNIQLVQPVYHYDSSIQKDECSITLRLADSYALERVLRIFSCFEKAVKAESDEHGKYFEMQVFYYRSDTNNIIHSVLHAGDHAVITAETNCTIKEMIAEIVTEAYRHLTE